MTVTSAVLLAIGAVAALVLLPPLPSPPRRRRTRRTEPSRPRGLSATERQLGLSRASAGDVHDRLTPMLREVARDRPLSRDREHCVAERRTHGERAR